MSNGTSKQPIQVIGGGLAGPEAAWQIARSGLHVRLFEMRPTRNTPAHQTDSLSELVCSNSFKSEKEGSAPWLLKEELRRLDSLSMRVAARCRVPAGHALTVDRQLFAQLMSQAIADEPLIELVREEATALPAGGDQIVVVASGPLTSDALAEAIASLTGRDRLFFFDSISPIVEADSIDLNIAFRASRWDASIDGTDDYLNCPFNRQEYDAFYDALIEAQQHHTHEWDNPNYFEACLPIEELARRGRDTLRFGPMKPVGLTDPRTGRWPYAAVQLRQEDVRAGSYNLVGFQNHLKYGDQQRVLRMIPGLEHAEFLRFGQIHRNTYINAPALLEPTMQLRSHPHVLFAGQISGVEGYVESMATGLMAGMNAALLAQGLPARTWPRLTAHGSLAAYITGANPQKYQPANITFDLLPGLPPQEGARFGRDKQARRAHQCAIALDALEEFLAQDAAVAS